VTEPIGGAHRFPDEAISRLGDTIAECLAEVDGVDGASLVESRRAKFLAMGQKGLP